MTTTASNHQATDLIDAVSEMVSCGINADHLKNIEAAAKQMEGSGQSIAACNVLGMVAALSGDTFEVERLFNAALQSGGNDAWTLGNYAKALNILATGLHSRKCEAPCLQAWEGQERRRPQFFDAMPGYFYTLLHRPDGSYSMPLACDAIRDLYGLSAEATTSDYSALLALVHPDDVALRQRKLDESERNLNPFHVEYRIVLPQKGARWIEVHALPQRMGDGGTRWDGFMSDVTERKRMESELRLKEFALDLAHDAVYLMDRDSADLRFVYVNEAACRALGYSREELMGLSLPEIDPYITPERGKVIWEKILANGSHTFEARHRRRDGSTFPVEIHGSMFEFEGRMLSLSLVRDITERQYMESELRLKEFVLDQAQIAVYLIGDGARITYVNDAACRALGYSREELLTMTTMDINVDSSIEASMAVHQKVLAEGECTFETRHVRRDGSLLAVEVWASTQEYQGKTIGVALAVDITERKRMEAELIARARDFHSLAQNIPDNVARWDREGRFLYSNPTHQRTLGKAFDELVGRTHGEIFPDGYFASFDEVLARVIATGKEARIPRVPVLTPSGGTDIHDVSLVPEFDFKGRVVSVLGLGHDMTDIYRMQEAIIAREQEFRSLAESSPDSIMRYDLDQRILYLNNGLVQGLGLASANEVIGQQPIEIWPDGRFAAIDVASKRVIENGRKETIELVWPDGSGNLRVGQILVVPEYGVDGRIIGTLAFGRDISEVKDAQRRMTDFVANFPGFAYTFRMSPDGRGSFPFASPGIEKLYGLQSADVKDDMAALHALAHPDDAPRVIAALAESARTMSPVHVEYRICRPGLPERWAEFRSSPVHEANGSVVWHGIMLDIDERKRAAQALEDSRTQLRGLIAQREDAREEERRYIAREIHDNLGQILSGLRLSLSRFARRYAADSDEMQAHFRDAGEIVNLAVQEVRNISAALRPVELDTDIRSALAVHLERFNAYTGIACELHAGEDMNLTEETHKLALYRIVQESLTNVVRHAQADKVDIGLYMEAQHCVLSIRDNGIGFDIGANKPKSFGLAGMQERAVMLGGSLIINSSPGKGTKIVVRIPVQKIMEES